MCHECLPGPQREETWRIDWLSLHWLWKSFSHASRGLWSSSCRMNFLWAWRCLQVVSRLCCCHYCVSPDWLLQGTTKGSSQLVLEVLMNGSYFQAVAEVPLQQEHIQQVLCQAHDAQKLSSSQNCLLPSSFLVLFHVPRDCFFQNGIHNKPGAEFAEPFLRVI